MIYYLHCSANLDLKTLQWGKCTPGVKSAAGKTFYQCNFQSTFISVNCNKFFDGSSTYDR